MTKSIDKDWDRRLKKMRMVSLIAPMLELFELFHGRSGREKRVPAAGNAMAENPDVSLQVKITSFDT